ncbi:MAG: hypothetical protein H6710_24550, partial [Myxococcales bacterium]|nr:hypothetical protein [Myxococcales bacterium]
FVVVAGASGTGKSSVVLGGFVPALLEEREPRWRWIRLRPGAAPLAALAAALARLVEGPVDAEPEAIAAAALAWREGHPAAALLVVVDQLEELFTQGADADARSAFARLLWRLAGDRRRPIAVLLTLRVDFIGACGEIIVDDAGLRLDRIAYDEEHRAFIPRPDRAMLRQVVESPAAAVGLSFEPGLVERILDEVEGEAGALPVLSHALSLLWAERSGRTLTQAAFRRNGGVAGALGRHAEALVGELDDEALAQARRLLVRLVSGGGGLRAGDTRARLPLERLRPQGAAAEVFDRVVARLAEGRLVVISEAEGGEAGVAQGRQIEVAHEALIRAWPRLQAWVDEDRQRIAELGRLAAWVVDFDERGSVLDGRRLAYAQEVAARSPDDIDPSTRALLGASEAAQAAREAEEAARRAELERALSRTRKIAIVAGVIAAVGLVLAYVAGWTLDAFKRESRLRLDEPLYTLLGRLPRDDPELTLSVLEAIEVADERWLEAADDALARLPERHLLSPASIKDIAVEPRGRRVALAEGATIAVVSLDDDAASEVSVDGPALSLAWEPPLVGERLLAVTLPSALVEVELGPPPSVAALARLEEYGPTIRGDAEDPRLLVFAPVSARLRMIAADGSERGILSESGELVTFARFIDDGAAVIAGAGDLRGPTTPGLLRLWRGDPGATPAVTLTLPSAPIAACAGPERLVALTRGGEVLEWSRGRLGEPPTRWPLALPGALVGDFDGACERVAVRDGDDRLIVGERGGASELRAEAVPGATRIAWAAADEAIVVAGPGGAWRFRGDGRPHPVAEMPPSARTRRVHELARCRSPEQLQALADGLAVGDLGGRDACEPSLPARMERYAPGPEEREILFTMPLVLLIVELVSIVVSARRRWLRVPRERRRSPLADGVRALPGVGMSTAALILLIGLGLSPLNVLGAAGRAPIAFAFAVVALAALASRIIESLERRGGRAIGGSARVIQIVTIFAALVLALFVLFSLVLSPLAASDDEVAAPLLFVFYTAVALLLGLYSLGLNRVTRWLRLPPPERDPPPDPPSAVDGP